MKRWDNVNGMGTPVAQAFEDQRSIREEIHSVQVGLDLMRTEMLAGDFDAADLTYAIVRNCLQRIASETSYSS